MYLAGEQNFLGAAASPSPTDLERYKAIALAAGKGGKTAGQVRELLKQQIVTDLTQHATKTGVPFQQHLATLKSQTTPAAPGVGGFNLFHAISNVANDVAKTTRDVEHVADDVIKKVGPEVNAIAKVAGNIPWGDIVHDVQGAIASIPGLGTVVSEAIAFGESAYDTAVALAHHNPIEAAIDAAYNGALAAVPGADIMRHILDPVKAVLIGLTVKHEPIGDSILDGVLTQVPDKPSFGKLSPRSVAGSLVHLIVKHVGIKKGGGPARVPPVVHVPVPIHALPPPAPPVHRPHAPVSIPAPHGPAPAPPVAHAQRHRPHAPKYEPYPT